MTILKKGTLYLIPVPLGDSELTDVLPSKTLEIARALRCYIAENAKSARQFLKKTVLPVPLQDIEIYEIDKHSDKVDFDLFFKELRNGIDTGLVSEAGMPAVADPGSKFVMQAHKEGIKVVPLIGPSSILLAIAASGLNGQSFIFHGYLPKEKDLRTERIRLLDSNARKLRQTQIFIETPYRNQSLFEDILQFCTPSTMMCVASEISLSGEFISTKSIAEWKKSKPELNKKPAVFLLL